MSSLIDVKDIQFHKNATVLRLNQRQAVELSVAIAKSVKDLTNVFEGVEVMTVPEVIRPKILVTTFKIKHGGNRWRNK